MVTIVNDLIYNSIRRYANRLHRSLTPAKVRKGATKEATWGFSSRIGAIRFTWVQRVQPPRLVVSINILCI